MRSNRERALFAPPKQGLYDPSFEHDACGVGFVANIKGKKSHEIIRQALEVLVNLDHRGVTDPAVLHRGMAVAVSTIVTEIKCLSKPLNSPLEIGQGAAFSSKGDESLRRMISDSFDRLGNEGAEWSEF